VTYLGLRAMVCICWMVVNYRGRAFALALGGATFLVHVSERGDESGVFLGGLLAEGVDHATWPSWSSRGALWPRFMQANVE
jgi:hypothetical protein